MRTNTLISKIRLGMSLPNIENRFSDAILLELANDEIQSTVLPWIFSLREDYLISSQEYDLTTITNGIIDFPQPASGRTLKDIWVSEDGKAYRPLQRIGWDEAWRFNSEEIDIPHAFSLQGNSILSTQKTQRKHHWNFKGLFSYFTQYFGFGFKRRFHRIGF